MNINTAQRSREHLQQRILPQLDLRPFINGQFQDTESASLLSVYDPFSGEKLADVPLASRTDVDRAVTAAHQALTSGVWANLHPRERASCLYRLANLIENELSDIATLESADTGKPIKSVRGWDIPNGAEVYRYYGGWADKITGDLLPPAFGMRIEARQEPVGVCALIIPWNFPFACIAWKMAPALAAGCSVIVKTAERAPLSAQYLSKLVKAAGFPDGVVNILVGIGEEAGRALVAHPLVNKVSFTGDVETARDILVTAKTNLPRLTLELGGKSPNVVFGDADLARAADGAISAMFSVQGQNCCAGSKTIVHRSVRDEFTRLLTSKIEARRLGDPLEENTEQGPQIDQAHVDRIRSYVDDALGKGASCLTGGKSASIGRLFFEPTVIEDVTDVMRMSREEVFGPVGALYSFDDEQEAIQLANDTEYGLAAGVWTSDMRKATRFVKAVRAGTCWVNTFNMIDTVAPWGGFGQSGFGRELGRQGLDQFLETKVAFWAD